MHSELGTNGIGAWRPDLTSKVRVLLHAKPLFDLKRGDSLRAPDLRHYDTLTLAIKICDLIVDNMGLESELNRTTILNALEPLLVKMDQAESIQPDHQRHKAIVEHVVGALSNDLEHRRPFSAAYPDFDNHGAATHRQMEYRLVSDYFHPAGGTVLRLSALPQSCGKPPE